MTFAIFTVGIAVAWAVSTTWLLWSQARSHEHAHARWTEERRELLNRIQRPEVLPTRPVENFAVPDRKPDEWSKVGTIELDMNGSDDGAG